MADIAILGTGDAMVTKCYNTCFLIRTAENGCVLVDAGGGNQILSHVEKAGTKWSDIKALFITHAHTDHIIGCIWVIRKINMMINEDGCEGGLNIYGFESDLAFLKSCCEYMLSGRISERIRYIPVEGDSVFSECGIGFTVIDILSKKKKQLGFRAEIPKEDGTKTVLVCYGDEPCRPECEKYSEGADWIMHEAMCLYRDEQKYMAYKRSHSTAKDAGATTERLKIPNLIAYHTEDDRFDGRQELYTAEIRENYSGNIFVPNDLDVIPL